MRLNEIKENREEGKVSPGALQRLEKEGTSKGDQGSSQRGRGKARRMLCGSHNVQRRGSLQPCQTRARRGKARTELVVGFSNGKSLVALPRSSESGFKRRN